MFEYYRNEWPKIVGSLIGTTVMFGLIYLVAKTIYG